MPDHPSEATPDKRELRKADRLTRVEARRTPHEFGVPANPYKSALMCAHCGTAQSSAIHSPQVNHKFSCNVTTDQRQRATADSAMPDNGIFGNQC